MKDDVDRRKESPLLTPVLVFRKKSFYAPKPSLATGILLTALGVGIYTWARMNKEPAPSPASQSVLPIYERNVLGGPEPETFTEINSVRYFSKVDGKDIRELLR